jgi:TPR repeat protein
MNRTFKAAAAALIFAVSFSGSVAAGIFDLADREAFAAYQKGDYATALRLWRSLADLGNSDAQSMLGDMYDKGQGVPRDYSTAVSWYSKAAAQGDGVARSSLITMRHKAFAAFEKRDYATALQLMSPFAENGDSLVQDILGHMYNGGLGVPQDYAIAHMWFNLAAAGGEKDAAKHREIVAKQMTPAQIAEAQKLAREWKPTSTPAPH